ncbi:MAG: hypothetical protein ABIA04_07960 [Pseudomonadota bacterium]
MKKLLLLGVLVMFMCFFTGTIFAESNVPDLKGKWQSKTYTHHHEKDGFFTNSKANGQWIIKEQHGRLFSGERTYIKVQVSKDKITEGFSGVISKNGKRIYMVDHNEDILFGDILADGSIELVLMNDGDESHNSKIGLMELERVK